MDYWHFMNELEEVHRQARILFLHSVFNEECKIEGKIYYFSEPYQAHMKYYGVFKNNNIFYIVDEDGDYRDVFATRTFTEFIKKNPYSKGYMKLSETPPNNKQEY
jgi:hypothetical protein